MSRKDGLFASVERGVRGLIFSILAFFGLFAIFPVVPSLHLAPKVLGGIYLAASNIPLVRCSTVADCRTPLRGFFSLKFGAHPCSALQRRQETPRPLSCMRASLLRCYQAMCGRLFFALPTLPLTRPPFGPARGHYVFKKE